MNKIISFLAKYKLSILCFLFLVLLPVVFNIYMLWLDVGPSTFNELLKGEFSCWHGLPCNPFPGIIRVLSVISIIISLLSQLSIILASKIYNTELPITIRLLIILIVVILTSLFIRWVSAAIMPSTWLSEIYDSIFFPYSQIAKSNSWYLVLPLSMFILVLSITIRIREGSAKSPELVNGES